MAVEDISSGLRLRWSTDGLEHRLIARPSGTEPKAKFYLQVAAGASDGAGADATTVEDALSSLVAQVRSLTD